MGGMLFGTLFGVIIVPGLYYIFGSMADGRKLIKDEDETPLSEDYIRSQSDASLLKKLKKLLSKKELKDGK